MFDFQSQIWNWLWGSNYITDETFQEILQKIKAYAKLVQWAFWIDSNLVGKYLQTIYPRVKFHLLRKFIIHCPTNMPLQQQRLSKIAAWPVNSTNFSLISIYQFGMTEHSCLWHYATALSAQTSTVFGNFRFFGMTVTELLSSKYRLLKAGDVSETARFDGVPFPKFICLRFSIDWHE